MKKIIRKYTKIVQKNMKKTWEKEKYDLTHTGGCIKIYCVVMCDSAPNRSNTGIASSKISSSMEWYQNG